MSDTIHMIGAAMQADVDSLRIASQNIANIETTAYRRQVAVTHLQFEQLLGNATGLTSSQSSSQLPSADAPQTQIAFDLQPGAFKSTAEPLHVAIDGPGFLVLQSDQDVTLTRRGDLRLASDGTLIASTGAPVMGTKGTIVIGSGTPDIGADGSVKINGDLVDQLRIANVTDTTHLVPLGDGSYRIDSSYVEEGDTHGTIRQGFLEASNVAPVNEMVQLMETVRRFETEQKFVLAYGGMLDKAISVLGKTS